MRNNIYARRYGSVQELKKNLSSSMQRAHHSIMQFVFLFLTMNNTPATIVAENSNKLINHTAWRITKCEYDLHVFLSPIRVCNMHASNNIKTTIFRSENNSKPNKNQSTQQMARNDESKWKKLHHILIFIFGHFITLMPTLYLSIYWYGFCCVRGQHFAC